MFLLFSCGNNHGNSEVSNLNSDILIPAPEALNATDLPIGSVFTLNRDVVAKGATEHTFVTMEDSTIRLPNSGYSTDTYRVEKYQTYTNYCVFTHKPVLYQRPIAKDSKFVLKKIVERFSADEEVKGLEFIVQSEDYDFLDNIFCTVRQVNKTDYWERDSNEEPWKLDDTREYVLYIRPNLTNIACHFNVEVWAPEGTSNPELKCQPY